MFEVGDVFHGMARAQGRVELAYNGGHAYYRTAAEYAEDRDLAKVKWVSSDEKARAITEDRLWVLNWGLAASTLSAALTAGEGGKK